MTDPRYLSRAQEPVPEALDKRLATYVLVAGAGLLAAPAAQAGVIYTPADVWMYANQGYYLDLDNIGGPEFFIYNWSMGGPSWGRSLWVYPVGPGRGIVGGSAQGWGYRKAYALGPSQNINAGAAWLHNTAAKMANAWSRNGSYYGPFGYWRDVSDRYLGLWFDVDGDGQGNYAWARLSVTGPGTGPGAYTAHLTGYAYESVTERGIHAGDEGGVIPEPGTLGLLAGGVLGLAIWRRKRARA